MTRYNEDTLVQQTTADYLRDVLGWESVLAWKIPGHMKGNTFGTS